PGPPRTYGSSRRDTPEAPVRRSYDPHLEFQDVRQFGGGFRRRAGENLRLLLVVREVDALQRDGVRHWFQMLLRHDAADLLGLRLFYAHERGVAERADAGLDGQQSRHRHLDPLKPPVFQFALY